MKTTPQQGKTINMQQWAETLTKRLKLTENIKSEDYFSSLCLVQYSQWKATNFFPWGVGG